ncbi:unnamed protein product, partial [Rotaria magnacalcarata]
QTVAKMTGGGKSVPSISAAGKKVENDDDDDDESDDSDDDDDDDDDDDVEEVETPPKLKKTARLSGKPSIPTVTPDITKGKLSVNKSVV